VPSPGATDVDELSKENSSSTRTEGARDANIDASHARVADDEADSSAASDSQHNETGQSRQHTQSVPGASRAEIRPYIRGRCEWNQNVNSTRKCRGERRAGGICDGCTGLRERWLARLMTEFQVISYSCSLARCLFCIFFAL
jgi:hypothetical protein